ncbi:MAG: group II intron reverse transcriptase/maturase, partial [Zetaproteobacteria bacterium CG17_big_fil_post_rev_8_21_14_2_50_50_13]
MSSDYSKTPSGELDNRRVIEESPADFASVEHIVAYASVTEAWKKVRANKGSPGVDGISIEAFPEWCKPRWKLFKEQWLMGSYQPSPALRVEIPKESGGVRFLGIPCV